MHKLTLKFCTIILYKINRCELENYIVHCTNFHWSSVQKYKYIHLLFEIILNKLKNILSHCIHAYNYFNQLLFLPIWEVLSFVRHIAIAQYETHINDILRIDPLRDHII
jgi:hypothetical protein